MKPTPEQISLSLADLSHNDIESVNATELELYSSLATLNLSRNKIASLFSGTFTTVQSSSSCPDP